jgi:signal transduction histidine kinase
LIELSCGALAVGEFPETVEVAAYYVVSESLTNAVKYADSPVVDVAVAADGGALRVEVRDDGCGGADPAEASGLLGLRDRVEAIGGTMRLTSPQVRGRHYRSSCRCATRRLAANGPGRSLRRSS